MAACCEKSPRKLSLSETISIVRNLAEKKRPLLGVVNGFIENLVIKLSNWDPQGTIQINTFTSGGTSTPHAGPMSWHVGTLRFAEGINVMSLKNLIKTLEESGDEYPATWLPQSGYEEFDLIIQHGNTTVFKTKYYNYPYIDWIPPDEFADAVEVPFGSWMLLARRAYVIETKSANKR